MLNSKAKVYKIFIKESLSQTIVIDVERSDYIELSFDSSINEDNRKEEAVSEVSVVLKEATGVAV